MIEILREPPQSTWILILFLVIVMIYAFLYHNDSRRFLYFFRSAFNKQYQVNYGRQSVISQHFMVLLSVQSILVASLLLYKYLTNCSESLSQKYLFAYSLVFILAFLAVKWVALFLVSILFKQGKLFQEFLSVSTQYANLFFSPLLFLTLFMYLTTDFSLNQLSLLFSVSLLALVCVKMRVFTHMRKETSLDAYYIILYICTFEAAPFLWFLIGLDC
jgi:hypothetical protein